VLWLLVPLELGAIAALCATLVRARRHNRQLEQLMAMADSKLMLLQRQFERFVPAELVEQLTEAGRDIEPRSKQVTILFADLRGFTAMCDRLDPALTVTILNDYFSRMIPAIARHHGQVTELVGDGLLALFGALENNPWQAPDAVLAGTKSRHTVMNSAIHLGRSPFRSSESSRCVSLGLRGLWDDAAEQREGGLEVCGMKGVGKVSSDGNGSREVYESVSVRVSRVRGGSTL
jgi:class 3 adenylate cyclase